MFSNAEKAMHSQDKLHLVVILLYMYMCVYMHVCGCILLAPEFLRDAGL
jgi:hypothetical protein